MLSVQSHHSKPTAAFEDKGQEIHPGSGDHSQEVLLVTGDGSAKEKAAIKVLLACSSNEISEKLQSALQAHGILVLPKNSFVSRNHERMKEAGFKPCRREDDEIVLRRTMPVCEMKYSREHIVDGVHIFDSDTAVIDVTMDGMVTLSIGDGRYDEPAIDADTPEGLGVLMDTNMGGPCDKPMLGLLEGLRSRILPSTVAADAFPFSGKKFHAAQN